MSVSCTAAVFGKAFNREQALIRVESGTMSYVGPPFSFIFLTEKVGPSERSPALLHRNQLMYRNVDNVDMYRD